MNVNAQKRYSTHMALLLKILDASEGDVLELGGGIFSTPLLHWYCRNKRRKLITYENDETYYNFAKQFRSKLHKIRLVKNWDDIDNKTHRGLVFIDHEGKRRGGNRRGYDAIRFKDSADYVVLHDVEEKGWKHYGYDEMWKHFKYRFDYTETDPPTGVVSNFYDLSWLENSQ